MAQERQNGKSYGNDRLYRWLIAALRYTDVRLLYAFMALCVIPVSLLVSPGARVAFRYYHHRRKLGWWKAWWATYRNHVLFGETVIDKFAMYAGRRARINFEGLDTYTRLASRPEAFVQLSAHIGCSEIVGYSYDNPKPSNVLAYGGENASLMAYRAKAFAKGNIRMIPVGGDVPHSDEIVSALDRGEIVCAFADRLTDAGRAIKTTLQGRPAKIARGPLSLAVTRGLDVVMTNAMKEKDGSYTAYFTLLDYDRQASRREQLQQLADAYAAEIERLLGLYPLQWFNYAGQAEE